MKSLLARAGDALLYGAAVAVFAVCVLVSLPLLAVLLLVVAGASSVALLLERRLR